MLSSIKEIWAEWNIRGAVLVSLLLQIGLILLSPLRRRTSNKLLTMLIWSAYLVADVVATFAIGLISKTHITNRQSLDDENPGADFLSLWAPFLLVHLGGPDTITAFALEDNQLWVRHLLSFAVQAFSTLYFFFLSYSTNMFKIPTFLMFIAGVIKYLERTCSLYLASKDKFRGDMTREPDPGLDYDKAAKYAQSLSDSLQQPLMVSERRQREGVAVELEMVRTGYENFNTVKALLADLTLGFDVRDFSRRFFFHIASAENALRVLEIELNFAYDILYTKVVVVHSTWGRFVRGFVILVVLLALLVFHFHGKPNGDFNDIDVDVTYALLYGALALDVMAFLMSVLSDWVVVGRHRLLLAGWLYDWVLVIHVKLLRRTDIMYKNSTRKEDANGANKHQTELSRCILFRRWGRSVSGFNLMTFCLEEPCNKIGLCIQSFVNEWKFKQTKSLTLELWEFIFLQLKSKSKFVDDAKSVRNRCYARGEVVLETNRMDRGRIDLTPYVLDIPYDESLLLWHVATELLYNASTRRSNEDCARELEKEFSKTLSEYMLYLMIMQPAMMATVSGIGKIRFEDTCAEARRFFERRGIGRNEKRNACKMIMDVKTEVQPTIVKGRNSTTVLFTASILAKELQKIEEEKEMWEVVGQMWVELMSYAAINCEKTAHCQQVSKGGELLTYVWLMMAHFGLSMQFQENASSLLRV